MKKLQVITAPFIFTALFTLFISINAFAASNSVQGYIIGDNKEGININIYKVTCGSDLYIDTVITNSDGFYYYDGLDDAAYKLIPVEYNYRFQPESITAALWYHLPNVSYIFEISRLNISLCALISSDEHTTQGFVFDDSAYIPNASITFDDGAGNVTVSVTGAAGGLENDRVYTGDEVAAALERAMEDAGSNLYTVTYDNVSNIFEIQNDGVDACIIDQASTINKVLGLSTTANTAIAAGAVTAITDSRIYYISEQVNDTFDITVDNNPILGTPVTVLINAGNYTGDELALALEDAINTTLDGGGESVSVNVRYDETDPSNKVFIIASASHNSGSSIDLDPGVSNFLTTIKISEYDEQNSTECVVPLEGFSFDFCVTWLNYTEFALFQAIDLIVEAKTLAIQMSMGTNEERFLQAVPLVEQITEQLLEIANTSVSDKFIFSGSKTETLPFTMDENLNVIYHGDNNQIIYTFDNTTEVVINITGQETFIDAANSFDALKLFYQALSDGDLLKLVEVIEELDASYNQLVEKLVLIGTVMEQFE